MCVSVGVLLYSVLTWTLVSTGRNSRKDNYGSLVRTLHSRVDNSRPLEGAVHPVDQQQAAHAADGLFVL